MSEPIIQTTGLDFYFKEFKALDQINLNVPQGSIFGFLGPNGAGKTTTIRILLDLFHSKPGQVKIFGKDLLQNKVEILGKVGALIENPSIYKHLSGRQNLEVIRKMVNVPKSRIQEVLKIVRLVDNADKKAKNYSLGMCQRLGLASALLTDPDLLILDEPTNGLDPSGIIEMRELILELNREHGKTIFLSSHILSEIEKLATDVAIIDEGKILYQGKLDGLQQQGSGIELIIEVDEVKKAAQILRDLNYTISEENGRSIHVPIESKKEVAKINKSLVTGDLDIFQLKTSEQNLESIFLNITKKLDQ
ncbi:ABC transporter ATP-binding protein [Roseivirga misakiensis]|uniref:Bacitracin ABC transporter ATP-binding protein n=1 Tax=Roseivirga misakiensis TaxID=1563681 RepID=A0A1E5T150_9BACT|nr:ATP-binding cassette domain-containing protein [Roseivirga misakiensis]OEK05100.1 bacitracin ABC transporter ATP-binding protein [Roseivirga misakiensis]